MKIDNRWNPKQTVSDSLKINNIYYNYSWWWQIPSICNKTWSISVEHCLESILRQARRFRANISVRGREVVVSDGSYHGWDCNSSWYNHFRNYWLIAEWPYFTCVKSTVTWVSTTPIPHMSDDFPMHHRPVQINIGFN